MHVFEWNDDWHDDLQRNDNCASYLHRDRG